MKQKKEKKEIPVISSYVNSCSFCGASVGEVSDRTGDCAKAIFDCPKCRRPYCDQCSYSQKIGDEVDQYCLRCESKMEKLVSPQ